MNNIQIHKKFKPLYAEKTRYYIITGERGTSKSFTVNTFLSQKLLQQNQKILFTRFTMESAKDSIIPEFNEKIELLNIQDRVDVYVRDIHSKVTNSKIMFRGIKTSQGDQTAKLKSLTDVNIWVLDEAEELTDEEKFNKIDLSIRTKKARNMVIIIMNPTLKSHFIYKRFFQDKVSDDFNGIHDGVTYINLTLLDNRQNIDAELLEGLDKLKKTNPIAYYKRLNSGWIDENEIGKIKITWFKTFSFNEIDAKAFNFDKDLTWDFVIDGAYTKAEQNDATAILAFARIFNNLYIRAAISVRLEMPELLRFIPGFCKANGYNKKSRIWIEPKASGLSIAQMVRADTKLNIIIDNPPKGRDETNHHKYKSAKEMRTDGNLPFMEAGRVLLMEGVDFSYFLEECKYFPTFEHDDLVDTLNMAIDKSEMIETESSFFGIEST
jgi:PBSX family phage terminase large subunit